MSIPCPKHARRLSFTLIELLVVIALMSILFVMAIPSFQAFKKKDIDTASRQLMSTIRLARQYAVTQRQEVYVVIPNVQWTFSNPEDLNKALQAYAVIASNRNTHSYEYIADWKYLPQGVYFVDDIVALSNSVFESIDVFGLKTQFPFPNLPSFRRMPTVMFKPNGRPYSFVPSGGTWTDGQQVHIPITTARFYQPNAANNNLQLGTLAPAGVTNIVRIRKKTGQVDLKLDD